MLPLSREIVGEERPKLRADSLKSAQRRGGKAEKSMNRESINSDEEMFCRAMTREEGGLLRWKRGPLPRELADQKYVER